MGTKRKLSSTQQPVFRQQSGENQSRSDNPDSSDNIEAYMVSVPVLYRSSVTATADIPFKLTPYDDMWFESFDIFILDESAYMGDLRDQDVPLNVGDVYYLLHPANLANFFFKNGTAGDNTRILVEGILLSDVRKKELGIPVT